MLSNHRFVEGGLFMTHFGSNRKTALADIWMEIFSSIIMTYQCWCQIAALVMMAVKNRKEDHFLL